MRFQPPIDKNYTENMIKNIIRKDNNNYIKTNSYNLYPRAIKSTERKHHYLRLQKTTNGIVVYYITPFDIETSTNTIKYSPPRRQIPRLLKKGYIVMI